MRLLKLLWPRPSVGLAVWLALGLLVTNSRVALAANIVVDSQFGDWAGKPNVTDPVGDVTPPRADMTAFYWATNPGDPTLYFMFQRTDIQGNQVVYYRIFVDTNCNGSYSEAGDRTVFIEYDPSSSSGATTVQVLSGAGSGISTTSGDWGETAAEGGEQTEFGVSFSDLGIGVNQTICFYAASYQTASGAATDGTAPIQDAPVPALGYPLLLLLLVGAVAVAWRRQVIMARESK